MPLTIEKFCLMANLDNCSNKILNISWNWEIFVKKIGENMWRANHNPQKVLFTNLRNFKSNFFWQIKTREIVLKNIYENLLWKLEMSSLQFMTIEFLKIYLTNLRKSSQKLNSEKLLEFQKYKFCLFPNFLIGRIDFWHKYK